MKKILIIEDNKDILEITSRLLSFENFMVIEANDGITGVKLATEKIPDLIVCDVRMPIFDGYHVLEELRKNSKTSKIPFVFLTVCASKEEREKAEAMNVRAYNTKPFVPEEFISTVKEIVCP